VTALGMLLTVVYIFGLIFRPRRQFARMGIDSVIVLVLYASASRDCSRSNEVGRTSFVFVMLSLSKHL